MKINILSYLLLVVFCIVAAHVQKRHWYWDLWDWRERENELWSWTLALMRLVLGLRKPWMEVDMEDYDDGPVCQPSNLLCMTSMVQVWTACGWWFIMSLMVCSRRRIFARSFGLAWLGIFTGENNWKASQVTMVIISYWTRNYLFTPNRIFFFKNWFLWEIQFILLFLTYHTSLSFVFIKQTYCTL